MLESLLQLLKDQEKELEDGRRLLWQHKSRLLCDASSQTTSRSLSHGSLDSNVEDLSDLYKQCEVTRTGLLCTELLVCNGLLCTELLVCNGLLCTELLVCNGLLCAELLVCNGLLCTELLVCNGLLCTELLVCNGLLLLQYVV